MGSAGRIVDDQHPAPTSVHRQRQWSVARSGETCPIVQRSAVGTSTAKKMKTRICPNSKTREEMARRPKLVNPPRQHPRPRKKNERFSDIGCVAFCL